MHLLLWSVGPVQDFIATARRTLDLAYGSELLSRIAQAAARAALAAGAEPILPSRAAVDAADQGIANKILLQTSAAPATVAAAMDQAARDHVVAVGRAVLDWASDPPLVARELQRETALDQLRDLLETSWAATPLTDDFPVSRRRVEHLLAATKAHRVFAAPSWGSDRPKSSLDGEREAVIDLRDKKGPDAVHARRKLGVLRQEVLCGVALLKRGGPRSDARPRIPSVSAQAAYPFLVQAARRPGADDAWQDYLRALGEIGDPITEEHSRALPLIGKHDPHLLYATRMGERFEDASVQEAERALRTFFMRVGVAPPGTYYAILQADGDRMGEVLDGARAADDLVRLGSLLVAFSAQVKAIVEQRGGSLVYAGGDDVLAFVPVDEAMAVGAELRALYQERVTVPARALVADPSTTLSVGIAIVHHLEPLSEALKAARLAEKEAKAVKGKDAWCISRVTRSGSPLTRAARWGPRERPFGRLGRLVDLYRSPEKEPGALSRGLPYDLREAADRLIGPGDPPDDEQAAALARSETRRLLGQKDVGEELVKELTTTIHRLQDMRDLADDLILARALTATGGAR